MNPRHSYATTGCAAAATSEFTAVRASFAPSPPPRFGRKLLLSREELYARVWAVPLVQLARQFGVSDVALGRMCRRRNIPCPPPGYWAKLRAGRPPPRPILLPACGRQNRPAMFTLPPSAAEWIGTVILSDEQLEVRRRNELLALVSAWEQGDRIARFASCCEVHWRECRTLTPQRLAWLKWVRAVATDLLGTVFESEAAIAAASTAP